jgi:hypothetical protein
VDDNQVSFALTVLSLLADSLYLAFTLASLLRARSLANCIRTLFNNSRLHRMVLHRKSIVSTLFYSWYMRA